MRCQRQPKPYPFNPDHDPSPLNRMGIASTWLPAHTEQQNCCTMGLRTTLHTMFQRRQKPSSFNPDHDACPLKRMGCANTWQPAQEEH
ncbi:hypothetical protein MRX96_058279 [Rhipicephalus microplus]